MPAGTGGTGGVLARARRPLAAARNDHVFGALGGGTCPKGKDCPFSHDDKEVKDYKAAMGKDPNLKGTYDAWVKRVDERKDAKANSAASSSGKAKASSSVGRVTLGSFAAVVRDLRAQRDPPHSAAFYEPLDVDPTKIMTGGALPDDADVALPDDGDEIEEATGLNLELAPGAHAPCECGVLRTPVRPLSRNNSGVALALADVALAGSRDVEINEADAGADYKLAPGAPTPRECGGGLRRQVVEPVRENVGRTSGNGGSCSILRAADALLRGLPSRFGSAPALVSGRIAAAHEPNSLKKRLSPHFNLECPEVPSASDGRHICVVRVDASVRTGIGPSESRSMNAPRIESHLRIDDGADASVLGSLLPVGNATFGAPSVFRTIDGLRRHGVAVDTADLRVHQEGDRIANISLSGIYTEEAELNVFAPNSFHQAGGMSVITGDGRILIAADGAVIPAVRHEGIDWLSTSTRD